MKKVALIMATIATFAAVAGTSAEARGFRVRAGTGAAISAAAVAAGVADAYYSGYGPGYYYGPGPVYYGAPMYVQHRGWYAY